MAGVAQAKRQAEIKPATITPQTSDAVAFCFTKFTHPIPISEEMIDNPQSRKG